MKTRKQKPKKPLDPDPDPESKEDEEDPEDLINVQSQITIGDVSVISKGQGLSNCRKELKNLLKDKQIKNYLKVFDFKKKISDSPPPYWLGSIG